jgi:myosin heavy subunit
MARASSLSVAPKSEYLRNALQARRAQQSNTPSPLNMRNTTPASQPSENRFATTSPDVFDEFELSEEQTRPVSPIRRRRPSEGGVPHSKTNRQLTDEIEKLKELLITSNMRVELLKKNNSELQHDMTKLKEKVEELEPLEEENKELQDENNYLDNKMRETEEEMERLKDENENLRNSHEEMLAVNVECSTHWEDQEYAVQEAADAIIALESEKAALAREVRELKQRVEALEYDSARARTLIDGSPRCPSRVYSIDESRPSTSHFDSDYYSQPESPVVKTSKESVFSITPSERSKKFLELTQERRRSARDLAKRMSTASLAALRIASLSPAPAVPQIPAEFQQQTAQAAEHNVPDKRSSKAPRRHREHRLPERILQEALEISPTLSESTASQSPTLLSERPRRPHPSDQSNESRPSSSQARTPTSTRSRHQQHSTVDIAPRVPSRRSSKQAHTNSSNEYLSQRDLHNPRQHRSESDMGSTETPRTEAEEWAPMSSPSALARSSLQSNSSLTSEVDSHDKDRWWRSVQPLTHQNQTSLPQAQQQYASPPHPQLHNPRLSEVAQQTPQSPTLTRSRSHHPDNAPGSHRPARLDIAGTSSASSQSTTTTKKEGRRTRTQPSTPAATSSDLGRDFFFNATEDADTFMKKAKAKMLGGRK